MDKQTHRYLGENVDICHKQSARDLEIYDAIEIKYCDEVIHSYYDDSELGDDPSPGQVICLYMRKNKMRASELVKISGLKAELVGDILAGKARITKKTSAILGAVFGVRPTFFYVLQVRHWEYKLPELSCQKLNKIKNGTTNFLLKRSMESRKNIIDRR